MAAEHSSTSRKLHAAIAAGKFDQPGFKPAFSALHNLTSRQFNTMALEVKGKIDGTRESLVDHLEHARSSLEPIRKSIAGLEQMLQTGLDAKGRKIGTKQLAKKALSLHEKKRKLGRKADQIRALERRIENIDPGICFGSRELFLQQFKRDEKHKKIRKNLALTAEQRTAQDKADKEAQRRRHEAWLKEWRAARSSQFLLVGSADEEAGCLSCQASLEPDGSITLRLRPFNSMLQPREAGVAAALHDDLDGKTRRRRTVTARAADYIIIPNIRFSHGERYILAAVLANQSPNKADRTPLTWRFLRGDDNVWRIHLSLDVPDTATFDTKGGALGVDFNADHIAATLIDKHGNMAAVRRFPLSSYGLGSARAKDAICCAARDVVAFARQSGVPIVGEKLDFAQKKRSMSGASAKRARQLSSLHYAAWGQALQSRCLRDGVALRLVNPAFTSLIGRVKFATSHGLSIHHAAAMVIARRGMNFSERLPSSSIRIPDGRGGHVTLDASVVNTKRRHVWSSWAKMTKVINEALAAQSQPKTKRKQVGDKPACGLADDWIPEFPHVGAEQGRLLGLAGEIPALRPDLPIDGRIPTSQNVRINTTQTKNLTQPGRF